MFNTVRALVLSEARVSALKGFTRLLNNFYNHLCLASRSVGEAGWGLQDVLYQTFMLICAPCYCYLGVHQQIWHTLEVFKTRRTVIAPTVYAVPKMKVLLGPRLHSFIMSPPLSHISSHFFFPYLSTHPLVCNPHLLFFQHPLASSPSPPILSQHFSDLSDF